MITKEKEITKYDTSYLKQNYAHDYVVQLFVELFDRWAPTLQELEEAGIDSANVKVDVEDTMDTTAFGSFGSFARTLAGRDKRAVIKGSRPSSGNRQARRRR